MTRESEAPIAAYRNFDLLITRAGDRYRAIVIDAPAGEASVLFDPPFAADEFAWLPDLVRDLTHPGRRLFASLFQEDMARVWAASLSLTVQEGAGLRLRLRFEEDAAELATLPWELLYDPAQGHFLGLGEQSPILRYLSLARSRSALLVEPPLRLLAVLSNPIDLPTLDLEREWQAIQDALAGLVAEGTFRLERLETPTLAALQERLMTEPVHILHFVGHGVFDGTVGSLALENDGGLAQAVNGEQVAAVLRNHPALRLAYLNACQGALASAQSALTGVAQTLVHGGVPAAVAMQAEVTDNASIELSRTFYAALAAGRPVHAALTQARVALHAAGSPEWAIPVLFSRSPDNRLFDLRAVLPTPDCPYPGLAPFTEAQQELFFGRDREIEDAVERLRQHPFLAVVGPSGSGKSSLVRAGVIPALRQSRRFGPGAWTVHVLRPSDRRTDAGQADPRQALARLFECSVDQLAAQTFDSRTLLFVDQLEEVFTLADAGEAKAFLDLLQSLIGRDNLYVLLTVRADFYPDLMASPLWGAIRANRLELTPLGDDELWAVIVEPAARVGVTVDEALAVRLIADAAGESGMLPLVQETLVLLWDRVAQRQLGLDAYRQMARDGRSGLQVAIDRRASLVYDNLPEAARPLARRIFLRLIQFGEGRADTRRQQTVAELQASSDDPILFEQTLARLTESRLLTTSGDAQDGARRVDIAHEALISGWPRLQAWLDEWREGELVRRRLENDAQHWHRQNGNDFYLYQGTRLEQAQAWASRYNGEGSQQLRDFLAASQRRDTRRKQVQLFLRGVMVVFALIGLVATGWATRYAILNLLARGDMWHFETSTALLGTDDDPEARGYPQRPVQVLAFALDLYEVTNRQYRYCVQAGVCSAPQEPAWAESYKEAGEKLPVVWVTAYQAARFCNWIGRRLPTETEWERAVRGAEGRPWPWEDGQDPTPAHVNLLLADYFDAAPTGLVPVDDPAFESGATPEGITHLLGNVWEWTRTPTTCDDPHACPEAWNGQDKVLKLYLSGFSWSDDLSYEITDSLPADPYHSYDNIGFRCARSEAAER